ncbi:MAG TPA: hypothetical protein VF587_15825 [Solirubrobacteraceae bacterium]
MRARAALLAVCAAVAGGCSPLGPNDGEEDTFACERGFRPIDWRKQTLKTAQSIEKCGWLNGWSERQVRQALGRWDYRTGRRLTYPVAISDRGIGPLQWVLTVKLDRRGGTVAGARTRTQSY